MSAKRGLGRGLGAILGDVAARVDGASPSAGGLVQLRVDAIRPNPHQPRTVFDAAALAELEASVRTLGVLVPILVRPSGPSTFEIIAGERRWRAAAAARLETVPAIVREVDDRSSLELAVVENVQRENLDPLEEAMGFAELMDEFAYTQEALAERVGKSRPAVANALRLLGLGDELKAMLRGGEISAGHARALLASPERERLALARRVAHEGLSVRALEAAIAGTKPERARRAPRARPDVAAAEQRLRYRLGAPVAIVEGARGGKIEIRFADHEDLRRVVDLLLSEEA